MRCALLVSCLAVVLAAPLTLAAEKSAANKPAAGEQKFPDEYFYYGGSPKRAQIAALEGKPAPLTDVTDWYNNKSPGDLKGKIVVIDIWATWCGPCLAAIPHNNEIAKKYADKGVVVVGVCSGGGEEKMAEVAKARGIEYFTAKDKKQATAKAWNVGWYPTYAVVDRTGKVRAAGLKPTYVDKVIDALIAEAPAASAPAPKK